MAHFEQLWYTWAETGLEGRSQLQVRAASEGLSDQRSLLARAARRLCQYEPPVGRLDADPVSFGWADFEETRFAFRRCDAGRDGFGRPGKFFVHILAGSVHELEAAWLAQRYGSTFWCSDDSTLGSSLILPQVGLADIAPGPLVEIEQRTIISFLTALVAARRRSRCLAVVTPDSALIGGLLAWTSDSISGTLDGLSVSTYESSSSAGNYNIVGIATTADAPAGALVLDLSVPGSAFENNGTVERIVVRLMEGGNIDTREAIAAANAGAEGEIRYDILIAAYDALASLRNGSSIDLDQILPAMRIPEGTSRVLAFSVGMEAVAAGLVSGREDIWEALESSARSLGGTLELAALGAAVGHCMWAQLAGPSSVSSINLVERARRMSVSLTASLVAALFEDAATDPIVLSRLSVRERVILVQQISLVPAVVRAGTRDPVVSALLRATNSEAGEFASAPIDDELRAWAVARGLECDPADSTLVAAVTRESRFLTAVVAALAEAGTLETVVRPLVVATPPSAFGVLSEVATSRRLSASIRDEIAYALAQRPDLVNAVPYIAGFIIDRDKDPNSERLKMEISELLCRLVPNYVSAQLGGIEQLAPPQITSAFQILANQHPEASAWNRLFMTLRMVPSGVWQDPRHQSLGKVADSIYAVGMARSRHAQEAAAECAADRLAGSCRSYGDVEELRRWLSPFIGSSVHAHSERMLRSASRSGTSSLPSLAIFQWIRWELDTGGMTAEGLRASGLLRRAKALVATQPDLDPILQQIVERSQESTGIIGSSSFMQRPSRHHRKGHRRRR